MRAARLKTNSKRKAAPNWEALATDNACKKDVLLRNERKMMTNDARALAHVTGKITFTSTLGPDNSCFITVGPIHAAGPVKFKTVH